MPWLKKASASGPCSALSFWSFPAMKLERLVPGHLDPLVLAAVLLAQEGRAQAIGVVVGPDAAGAARTEPAARQRIGRVALDLPQPAVLLAGDRAALPEAEVAVGGDGLEAIARLRGSEEVGPGGRPGGEGRCRARPRGPGTDLQKTSSREDRHGIGSVTNRFNRETLMKHPKRRGGAHPVGQAPRGSLKAGDPEPAREAPEGKPEDRGGSER